MTRIASFSDFPKASQGPIELLYTATRADCNIYFEILPNSAINMLKNLTRLGFPRSLIAGAQRNIATTGRLNDIFKVQVNNIIFIRYLDNKVSF